jgi:hypothetical protein
MSFELGASSEKIRIGKYEEGGQNRICVKVEKGAGILTGFP